MSEEPGICDCLASITFCAIIATGYSKHSVRCLRSGKANEAAVNELIPARLRREFAFFDFHWLSHEYQELDFRRDPRKFRARFVRDRPGAVARSNPWLVCGID